MRAGDGSIKADLLKALVRRSKTAKDEASEITKDAGEDIKAAVVTYRLNRRAFTFCVGLARMKEIDRVRLWRAIESYVDILGLDQAEQIDLEDAIAERLTA